MHHARDSRILRLAQAGGLAALGYIEDLISNSSRPSFTREEVLVLLNLVKHDTDLFDADVLDEIEQAGDDYDKRLIAAREVRR